MKNKLADATRRHRLLGMIALGLLLAQLALMLLSWIVSAAAPDWPVHSLLSGEGIRWFLRLFGGHLSSPLLLWLVLATIAYGTFKESGLATGLAIFFSANRDSSLDFRQRLALRFVCVELLVFLIVVVLLAAIPHAVLLSVTGELFPSSFSQSVVPVLALVVTVCSLSYGFISGRLTQIACIYQSLTAGFVSLGWIFPLYILVSQLYYSVCYVFG